MSPEFNISYIIAFTFGMAILTSPVVLFFSVWLAYYLKQKRHYNVFWDLVKKEIQVWGLANFLYVTFGLFETDYLKDTTNFSPSIVLLYLIYLGYRVRCIIKEHSCITK